MSTYSMPGEVFKKLTKSGISTFDAVELIKSEAGLMFLNFDETHVHFNVVDSKKLLLFLLKI